MKQFFEQYGGVALGILALLVLIAMITPVGNIIKTSLQGTVQTFSAKIDNQTDTMTEGFEQAFHNVSALNGIANGKVYYDNELVPYLSSYTFENNGKIGYTPEGNAFKIKLDLNVDINGNVMPGGYSGVKCKVYSDGKLILDTNTAGDWIDFDVATNHQIKVVITDYPADITPVYSEKIYSLYDLAIVGYRPDMATFDFVIYIPFTR